MISQLLLEDSLILEASPPVSDTVQSCDGQCIGGGRTRCFGRRKDAVLWAAEGRGPLGGGRTRYFGRRKDAVLWAAEGRGALGGVRTRCFGRLVTTVQNVRA